MCMSSVRIKFLEVKIFSIQDRTAKSAKIFTREIFRLYGMLDLLTFDRAPEIEVHEQIIIKRRSNIICS